MKRILLLTSALALAGCAGQGPGLFNGPNNTPVPPAANNAADPNAADPNAAGNGEQTANNDTTNTNTNSVTVNDNTTTVTTLPPATNPPPATTPPVVAAAPEPEPAPTPAPAPAGDGRLGTTVASIGANEPGFWIKTPLVSSAASGRLFYPASGRTVQVQLIPSGGASGSGSQVSMAALRLLDAPIDGLPELVVYQN